MHLAGKEETLFPVRCLPGENWSDKEEKKMHTRIFPALFFLVAFPLWAVAAESSSADQFHLVVKQGKITVKAKNVPARQFFEELESKSTIPINYLGKADERLSADIINCPLATGLSLITRNFNHSIIYNNTNNETGLGISALFIFSKEKEGGLPTQQLLPTRKDQGNKMAAISLNFIKALAG